MSVYYTIHSQSLSVEVVNPSPYQEQILANEIIRILRKEFPETAAVKTNAKITPAEVKVSPEEIFKAEELGVVEKDGRIMVGSRAVAKAYEKQHAHILEAIRRLECTEKFRASNFRLANYKDARQHLRPEYFMTRDGFVFLVMGFTGKLAAKFKEAYINAFNTMEAMLRSKQIPA